MKIPVRKLKTLAQYSSAAAFVIFVVFVVSNFKEGELQKSSKKEDSEWDPPLHVDKDDKPEE